MPFNPNSIQTAVEDCDIEFYHTRRFSLFCLISVLQVVAAFAVSAVASQWERTGKPFNPLLGETYELIRYRGIESLVTAVLSVFDRDK